MKIFKVVGLVLAFLVLGYQNPIYSDTFNSSNVGMSTNPTGYTVAVWTGVSNTDYTYNIQSAVFSGGTWSSPVNLITSDSTLIFFQDPLVAVNNDAGGGDAVAIWLAGDIFFGVEVLYGSTLPFGGSWSTPVRLSTDTEHVFSNYNVTLTDSGSTVVTWTSYDLTTSQTFTRSSTSASFGSFGSAVSISN